MSYLKGKNCNSNSIQSYTLKTVAAAVMLSLSSGAYAACDYTAGDDFDNDGITNLQDGAPCDADLQKITINRVINGDFEAGANFWTTTDPKASYTSLSDSFDGSTAIQVTNSKNNKGINAPGMTANGFSTITVNFWAKAVTVSDHTKPLKVKLILEAEAGSLTGKGDATSDKFIDPIRLDNLDDPDLTDDTIIINATEWTPITQTFILADIQAEAQAAIDADIAANGGDGLKAGTKMTPLVDGKYTGRITLQIQPDRIGDIILIDNISVFGDTDKAAMQLNAITDSDGDGLMDDVDAHPNLAYFTESKPNDDFDGDGVINSEDALPYNENASVDSNNDGYADSQTAPLVNALSATGELELTDAEKDNWATINFVSSKDALIGNTSYKFNSTTISKAKTVNISANEQVVLGFWAKTDAAGAAADGDILTIKAKLVDALAAGSHIVVNQVLTNNIEAKTDLTTDWQYFQAKKSLTDPLVDIALEISFFKATTLNAANVWIDGIVVLIDPDIDALKATTTDTDGDGRPNYWDNDDDNDGLLDGEDSESLNDIGSFDAPDIDHDGVADTLDADNDGILDYYEDRTAPVITLVGGNTTITVGGTYTELKATATDDIDGDITGNIITSGNVDTATIGEYTISYNVSDAEGNAASEVTRTINIINEPVIDTTAPIITLLGDSPATVIEGGVYTDAGATALDDTDGDITLSIATTGSVDTATVGEYTIAYNVSDTANNVATAATRTIFVVAPDTTKPVITITGDTSITLAEGDVYTDAGATATDGTDGDISGDIETDGSVDTATVGDYTITYTVSDAAGNISTASRVVSVADSTKPVITLTGETAITLVQGATYTDAGATATDDTDGNISDSINVTSNVDSATAGIYTITYSVTDVAGNAADTVSRKVYVNASPQSNNGGSFSFAGLFLMVGLFTRRLLSKK